MLKQDLVLLFNCFFFCLFGLPHIFSADGNLTEMGWAWQTKFMPMKSRSVAYPVAEEMQLLVTHLAAIVGGVQTTMAICCLLFATLSTDKNAKKLVIGACLYFFASLVAIQFYKPSGTGVEGSPATGPWLVGLPILVAMAVPSVMGLF